MKFIDLFAGTGGIRLGFESALMKIGLESECVFSSEIDQKACETYSLNFNDTPHGNLTKCSDDIPSFDFLLAGFPCQPFSYAGKRQGFGDTRGTLFFEVEKIIKKHRPKGVFLENVRGLSTHDKGRTLATILHALHDLGYSTHHILCNSSNYGVPQNRVRIYIMALLEEPIKTNLVSDLGAADSHKYKSQHSQPNFFSIVKSRKVVGDILESQVDKKYVCSPSFMKMLSEAIEGNFESLHGVRLIDFRGGNSLHSWDLGIKGKCTVDEREFMTKLISNRRKKIFGTHQDGKMLTKEQIETFFPHPEIVSIMESLISKGYLKCIDGKYNPVCGNMSFEVFKFLDPESISITLTSSDTHKLGIVQNGIPRRITPREAARLQGFPETFVLHPNDAATYKQLGNAVSVPVIEKVIMDMFECNPVLQQKKKRNRKVSHPVLESTYA